MSLLLAPPPIGLVRVRYLPDRINQAILTTVQGQFAVTVAFTPWIIGPSMIASPQVISGLGWRVSVGHYTVVFDAPIAGESMPGLGIMRSQPRPRL